MPALYQVLVIIGPWKYLYTEKTGKGGCKKRIAQSNNAKQSDFAVSCRFAQQESRKVKISKGKGKICFSMLYILCTYCPLPSLYLYLISLPIAPFPLSISILYLYLLPSSRSLYLYLKGLHLIQKNKTAKEPRIKIINILRHVLSYFVYVTLRRTIVSLCYLY